jgi:16S rRNA (uracil1498-N3)-methyltransferase
MDARTLPRLFVRGGLAEGGTVEAGAAAAHHLGTVLRRGPGDRVRVFNGADGEWLGRVAVLRKQRCEVVVEARLRAQEAEPDLWLAYALLKRDAGDLVVEKATELGVAALLPVLTQRAVAGRVNGARLASIAVGAAEQCERLTVPRVAEPVALAALLAAWPAGRPLVAALERQGAPPPHRTTAPAGLLIGPEGGFTDAELDLLRRHPLVVPAGFGARILRAETAAIVGLALMTSWSAGQVG